MISVEVMERTLRAVLTNTGILNKINIPKLVEKLNDLAITNKVELSPYGYIMWVIEHAGTAGIYRGQLSSLAMMDGYATAARKYKEDMPLLLVNASKYVDKVFNTLQDPDLCMSRLEGMTFPYVLYILFAGGGQKDIVTKYRKDAIEHLNRYPGTLQLLPDKYKEVGNEVLNANA